MKTLPAGVVAQFTIRITERDGKAPFMVGFSTYAARPGEDWERGNDLSDGDATEETLQAIFDRIRVELFGHDA